ncbi:MAG: DUF721 domain-containing protein [Candidatus Magasanikbacteria bacterium]|jgi:hypothetical protein|nr:DUF721 domain-containing protein [Candidatus Magasanikbacteria bacterium]
MGSFTPIGDTLHGKMQKDSTLAGQLESQEVLDAAQAVFDSIFDEKMRMHIKPLFLKNRTLTVTCSSSAVAQEIRLNQSSIVKKINKALGKAEVDRIRYLA